MGGIDPGLCASCVFGRAVLSGKGSVFWLCERSKGDASYRKYPPLPVVRCRGYLAMGVRRASGEEADHI